MNGRKINSRLARSWIGATGGILLILVGFVLFGLGTSWLTSYPAFASTTAFGEEAFGIVILVVGIVVAIWA